MSTRSWFLLSGSAALLLAALLVLAPRETAEAPPEQLRGVTRSDLELRGDLLYARGEAQPFSGTMTEHFPDGTTRVSIEIRDGRPHGRSQGWHENGQLEVEEHFLHGVSHGQRRRWFADGTPKSEASIVNGRIEGIFVRWHENGRKAAVITMKEGLADGLSEAWTPAGELRTRAMMKEGKIVERRFFEVGERPLATTHSLEP